MPRLLQISTPPGRAGVGFGVVTGAVVVATIGASGPRETVTLSIGYSIRGGGCYPRFLPSPRPGGGKLMERISSKLHCFASTSIFAATSV